MALTLARSFLRWNTDSNIEFFIVTDQNVQLPQDLGSVNVLRVQTGELGPGFAPKLHLDRLAQTDATLFIDADCLCFAELNSVFDRFKGCAVSVVGGTISEGEWFGDVRQVCIQFGVGSLPKFNGGIYYLERGGKADSVYARARELQKEYDELGFRRLRGSPNDEVIMALAMALEGCAAIPDDGSILGDLFSCPNIHEIDVIRGVGRISNPPVGDTDHRNWYPVGEIRPRIVHFLGDFTSHHSYRAADITLMLARTPGVPAQVVNQAVKLFYRTPASIWEQTKISLRPLYHQMFGPRRMKRSERV